MLDLLAEREVCELSTVSAFGSEGEGRLVLLATN